MYHFGRTCVRFLSLLEAADSACGGPSVLGAPRATPAFTSARPAPRAAGYATLASRTPPTYRGGARQCWPVISGPIAELDPAWTYPTQVVCDTGQLAGRPQHTVRCAPCESSTSAAQRHRVPLYRTRYLRALRDRGLGRPACDTTSSTSTLALSMFA